ncbi:MAG: M20 metallopeptidase family protein [Microthrixaceae bacterium]
MTETNLETELIESVLDVEALKGGAGRVLDDAVGLRRAIHRQPELGLDLPKTQQSVIQALGGLDLDVRTGQGLSSVVADLDTGSPGPTVLLRGDMDALPMPEDTGLEFSSEVDGRMHACGHDAHTSMLVGAARVLHDRRAELRGRVRFMFQPGEEGAGGAPIMIDEGVLDGVDAAFALHVAPNLAAGSLALRAGPMLAATDDFVIRISGRGGHASTPQWATDPIPVAAEVVIALQTMITRTLDVFNPAVLTVGRLTAGTTENVIPESAEMAGTLRTVDEAVRTRTRDRIATVAEGIAAAHGCTATVEITEGYPVTVNDADLAEFVGTVARVLLGGRMVFDMPAPVMGAEDFSYVGQRVPAVMAFLGVCPPSNPDPFAAPACHSNRMVLHEESMATGIALHAAIATALLEGGLNTLCIGTDRLG